MTANTLTDHQGALANTIGYLNEALAAQANAKAAEQRAVAEILSIVRAMRAELDSPNDPAFLAVLRHLYWQHRSIPSNDLSDIAGFRSPGEMTAAIGSMPSGIFCEGCGKEIRRTSRSWKPPQRYGSGPIQCTDCRNARIVAEGERQQVRYRRASYAAEAAVAAPVVEWQIVARLVLAYPPITTGYKQGEYPQDGLWLAYEEAQVLSRKVAACGGTHLTVGAGTVGYALSAAHDAVGFDLTRTWELVTPLTNEAPTAILSRLERRIREAVEVRQAEAVRLFPMPADEPA